MSQNTELDSMTKTMAITFDAMSKVFDDRLNDSIEQNRRDRADTILSAISTCEKDLVEAVNGPYTKDELLKILTVEFTLLKNSVSRNLL